MASTQVQALDLDVLTNELLRLSTIPKIEKSVPAQNRDDEQIQAKTVENVPAQNRDDEPSQRKIQNNSNISTSDAELKQWINLAEIYYKDDVREFKQLGINSPEEAREWGKLFGFNYDLPQLKAFIELGIDTPQKVSLWHKIGIYDAQIIEELGLLGIKSPEKAEGWVKIIKERGVSGVQDFMELGIKNPKDAVHWFELSLNNADIMNEWFALNVTTVEQFMKWASLFGYSEEYKDRFNINRVRVVTNFYNNKKNALDLYISDNNDLKNSGCEANYHMYIETNTSLEEAKIWCKMNLFSDDFNTLTEASIHPEELSKISAFKKYDSRFSGNMIHDISKWKKNGFNLNEFDKWYELKNSGGIENCIEWKQKGFSFEASKSWFDLGINRVNILEDIKRLGINSLQEAQQWKAVGVGVGYTSIFQQWLDMGFDTPAKIKVWTIVLPDLLSEDASKHSRAQDTLKAILNAGYKTPEQYKVAQQKEQKEKEKLKQERAKVKKVCDAWYNKATEKTYSLKSGARIWSRTSRNVYTIDTVYPDSFLVWGGGTTWEMKKHLFVPYNELANAPSEYCYK